MEYLHKGEDFSEIKAGECSGLTQIPADICPGEVGTGLSDSGCIMFYCSPEVNIPPCKVDF